MRLEYKDYIAEEENGRFNLYKKRIAKKKNGEEHEVEDVIGYSYPFERMLIRMTHDITSHKDLSTIHGYIAEFRETLKEVTKIFSDVR